VTPTYRYLLCDLLTDQLLADLPLTGVGFDRRVSRVGSLQGTLLAPNPRLVEVARLAHRYAGRAALWVLRDGAVWWGGIPWTVVPSQGPRGPVQVSLTAATFDSYAHRRWLPTPLQYTQVDQGIIIPDLWRRIQADPRGDIGMVAEDQPTGVLRDRTYVVSEGQYVGKLIEDMGDVIDGPEHTVDVYLDGNGNRVKRLRVADRLGVSAPRTVFQRAAKGGGRVVSWELPRDAVAGGTRFRTRGDAPNGNVGEEKEPALSDTVEASTLLAQGWPLLDVMEDRPGVIDQATLDGHAQALAAQYAGAPQTAGYDVQVGNTGWSPNRIGDAVRIKLQDDWHTGDDLTVRPVGCKVTPPEGDQPETVKLLLGDEDD
jgi:hypothetical protein